MNYLLFNPLASNGKGAIIKEQAKIDLEKSHPDLEEINVLELDPAQLISNLTKSDVIILVGGDGTLNHFANAIYEANLGIFPSQTA